MTPEKSWVSGPFHLTALNDSTLLFAADDGSGHGPELWESDGTASGTTVVKDLSLGPVGSSSNNYGYGSPVDFGGNQYPFTVSGGAAYFSASDGANGQELWKSDGTAAGTTMVKDIAPGSANSSPQSITDVNGTVYFVAHDGSGSNQLWMTDGTSDGTSLVQNFTPGADAELESKHSWCRKRRSLFLGQRRH